jgi:hypothetical protein
MTNKNITPKGWNSVGCGDGQDDVRAVFHPENVGCHFEIIGRQEEYETLREAIAAVGVSGDITALPRGRWLVGDAEIVRIGSFECDDISEDDDRAKEMEGLRAYRALNLALGRVMENF